MEFDFDHSPQRHGSDSAKWRKYAGRDVLPMWVADMDFPAPPAVSEALHRRVDHGVFGYGDVPPSTVVKRRSRRWRGTMAGGSIPNGWCGCRGW